MTMRDFISECRKVGADPVKALENDKVRAALVADDVAAVRAYLQDALREVQA